MAIKLEGTWIYYRRRKCNLFARSKSLPHRSNWV